MKRFLSIFLVAMLIVTCLATVAFAAGTATVAANHKTAKAGEEVSITYTVTGEFANYELWITSDSTLTLTGISGIVGNTETGKVAYASAENVTSHSFTATFKVSDSAKPGTYPVSATINFVADRNLVKQDVTVSAGSVTITCDHAWGAWTETKAPTCTEAGVETRACTKCGETETRSVAAKGHTWGAWEVTKAASCGEKGEETRTCSVCGETETRAIDATAHNWGAWTLVKAATCTEDGEETRECSICGETETRAIKAHGHEWGEDWTLTKEPTATEKGEETRWCLNGCGEKQTRDVPALGEKDPDIDPVPETGDITTTVIMTGALVLAMMAAAYVLFFKRQAAK